jgi:hypothetical protein
MTLNMNHNTQMTASKVKNNFQKNNKKTKYLRPENRSRQRYLFREAVRKGQVKDHYYDVKNKFYVYLNPKTFQCSTYN